uniref:Tripartite motif containing 44 n=1 Tax=Sphaeramia orbicularis TaxID=375764 RepID=A0A673BQD4_9TELE
SDCCFLLTLLPQMDGSCDACEPDEAQPATQVCRTCSFAFCPLHADKHASSTHHLLMPYNQEKQGTRPWLPQSPGKRDTVTVERLRCKEHGQEGSLYCKPDEKIICVVCAVQGEHREHEIITLHEAYVWQKVNLMHRMSTEELEAYVNTQFDETLHLVDLKEAFLTASAAEKIAEITLETERLQEEMDNITHQLCLLEKGEDQAIGPAVAMEALKAARESAQRNLMLSYWGCHISGIDVHFSQ